MIRRHELSDAEGEFVRPLLPVSSRGRKRLDDRSVLNGIVWKFRTGTAWRDVPERYGPWATLHTGFRRWAADGTFERIGGWPRDDRNCRNRSSPQGTRRPMIRIRLCVGAFHAEAASLLRCPDVTALWHSWVSCSAPAVP
ncbi:transposase [Streptomyces mirabilis]|uniref:transposase n=1 Tax=Streptomyces mirabilis TaxID=68239 RepID=UPI0036AE5C9C